MGKLMYNNQRKDLRIPFKNDVRFSKDQFRWDLGKPKNISKGGIFVETERMFKVVSKVYMNLTLTTGGQIKKIKAVGKVMRLANAEEKGDNNESPGIGIKFYLLPSEELMIRSFIRGIVNQSVPVFSSSLSQSGKHILNVEIESPPFSLLKWWLKEAVTKAFSLNSLIVELALLVIILLVLGVFLKW